MASINSPLSDSLEKSTELQIVKQLWGKQIHEAQLEPYRPYFRYYATECRRLQLGISEKAWQSTTMAARTHSDLLIIVNTLSLNSSSCNPEIRTSLQTYFPHADDIAIKRSIDLALRIWLTLNVREECFKTHTPRTPTIQWDDTTTLSDFIAGNFPHATTSAGSLQLDHNFTAANIHRLSGIDIEWTPCLADHLRFDKRRRLLRVYPFKQILLDHLDRSSNTKAREGEPENGLRLVTPRTKNNTSRIKSNTQTGTVLYYLPRF